MTRINRTQKAIFTPAKERNTFNNPEKNQTRKNRNLHPLLQYTAAVKNN